MAPGSRHHWKELCRRTPSPVSKDWFWCWRRQVRGAMGAWRLWASPRSVGWRHSTTLSMPSPSSSMLALPPAPAMLPSSASMFCPDDIQASPCYWPEISIIRASLKVCEVQRKNISGALASSYLLEATGSLWTNIPSDIFEAIHAPFKHLSESLFQSWPWSLWSKKQK